jgi:hypothetical protein
MTEKRYTEAEWRAIDDLRKNWASFCDADPFHGAADFAERMEAAGFIRLRRVTRADLEQAFAADLGIERGGCVWDLTAKGRRALVPPAHQRMTKESQS